MFDQVVGQTRVKNIFNVSHAKGRLAHAYLFHGPPGVGKDAMALALTKTLNCENQTSGGCGTCGPCLQIGGLEYPGFKLVLPVPTRPKSLKQDKYFEIVNQRALDRMANPYGEIRYTPEIAGLPNIGIDQVRALKREVMLKISGRGTRVFILSHADKMTVAAGNSLLKLLEEPPERTLLFLTTAFMGRLLPTIVSRCQSVRFDPLSAEDMEKALVSRWGLPSDKAAFIARMAGGSLQRALNLVEDGFEEKREAAWQFLEISLSQDAVKRIEGVQTWAAAWDKAQCQEILQLLLAWIRDVFLIGSGQTEGIFNTDYTHVMEQFIKGHGNFQALSALHAVERAIDFMEKNVYLPLVLGSLSHEIHHSQ